MADPLVTYLQDHLAGARFAVGLLDDLSQQDLDAQAARFAAKLLSEVESDRVTLEEFAKHIGGAPSLWKEAAAWMANKGGRVKLSLDNSLGIFEAFETLALGVQGKLALWTALETVRKSDPRLQQLDLENLIERARNQYSQLESFRLQLSAAALLDRF